MTMMVGLLALILMLGLVVAVCIGLAWLFSSHPARAALVIPLLLLPLAFLWWLKAPDARQSQEMATIEAGDRPAPVVAHVQPSTADVPAPASMPPAGKPASSGTTVARPVRAWPGRDTTPMQGVPPAQSQGLLRMLSGALLRALEDDDSPQPGTGPVSETARVEAGEVDALAPSPSSASTSRPAWVDSVPHREGNEYQVRIDVGPYTTREECDKKLPEELLRTVDAYAATLLGSRASGRVQLPPDYVQANLIRDTWEERRVFPLSPSLHRPMVQLHVFVGFDAKAAEKIRNAWKQIVVEERVYRLAAVGIVLLLSLGIAWAYLRLDLSTAGRYRWRLGLAAAAALVAVVFFGLTLS
jgi:hypothetical protein